VILLNEIKDTSLFYPCCGDDLDNPLRIYIHLIKDFWFVDILSHHNHINDHTNKLLRSLGYEWKKEIKDKFNGITLCKKEYYAIEVKTFTYIKISDGREVNIHRCCGKGYDALRSVFDGNNYTLGVFFYCGDSPGEGGSGFYWLGSKLFPYVLGRLADGGQVVTDGSNVYGSSSLKRLLAKFHSQKISQQEAMTKSEDFTYNNHRFNCIGHAGKRYGPVLIWKVKKTKNPT
jgi:hypothetical protein